MGENMKIAIPILLLISLFSMLCIPPISSGKDCAVGAVHAWFRTTNGLWEHATAHPFLKRGQCFEIKIVVTMYTPLQGFYLKLHEFGEPVYEVIEGPTKIEQILEVRQPLVMNHSYVYYWRLCVRVNTSWVNAYGPLEVYVQFQTDEGGNDSWVDFDVMTAYILDELLKVSSEHTTPDSVAMQSEDQQRISPGDIMNALLLLCFTRVFFQVQWPNYNVSGSFKRR